MKFKHVIIGIVVVWFLISFLQYGKQEASTKRASSERVGVSAATSVPRTTPRPTSTFAQWQRRAEEIPYDTLLRSADQLKGKLVYYRGEVGYVTGTREQAEIKVRVKDRGLSWDRDSEVLVYFRNPAMKVFEGDIVEFIGLVDGYYPFNPIPAVVAVALEIEKD